MGNKCLVTSLNGVINDNSLLKVGELRIKVTKLAEPKASNRKFQIQSNKTIVVSIVGNGYFTDSNLSTNKGTELTINPGYKQEYYFSNGDYEISIPDKYSLEILDFYNTKVKFDVNSLMAVKKLYSLNLYETDSEGDIKVLEGSTNMQYFYVGKTNITGDFAVLQNCSNLVEMQLTDSLVYGDLAMLPNSLLKVYGSDKTLNWTVSARTKAFASLIGVKCNNIDQMLKDLATMEIPSSKDKVYSLYGTRTSASDNAVSTLQSKGYTISITN